MMSSLTCFNAYDVRGRLGDELGEGIAYRIARANAQHLCGSNTEPLLLLNVETRGNTQAVLEHADRIAALIGIAK